MKEKVTDLSFTRCSTRTFTSDCDQRQYDRRKRNTRRATLIRAPITFDQHSTLTFRQQNLKHRGKWMRSKLLYFLGQSFTSFFVSSSISTYTRGEKARRYVRRRAFSLLTVRMEHKCSSTDAAVLDSPLPPHHMDSVPETGRSESTVLGEENEANGGLSIH